MNPSSRRSLTVIQPRAFIANLALGPVLADVRQRRDLALADRHGLRLPVEPGGEQQRQPARRGAAALDGYRVHCAHFDPQETLSHSTGLTDVSEEQTVQGTMARDLIRETDRMNAASVAAQSDTALPRRTIPASIHGLRLQELRVGDFIRPTNWPSVDIIPSCANAAFVEFASAQYRPLNPRERHHRPLVSLPRTGGLPGNS